MNSRTPRNARLPPISTTTTTIRFCQHNAGRGSAAMDLIFDYVKSNNTD